MTNENSRQSTVVRGATIDRLSEILPKPPCPCPSSLHAEEGAKSLKLGTRSSRQDAWFVGEISLEAYVQSPRPGRTVGWVLAPCTDFAKEGRRNPVLRFHMDQCSTCCGLVSIRAARPT